MGQMDKAKNASFAAAREAKEDEFYTQRSDIENELAHYSDHFRDKIVYCNCDDPVSSEFWQFFVRNFIAWGIKKLIATHYDPNAQNYSYKLEMEPDENGQFSIYNEPKSTPIMCNGDFRSAICIEILKEADIIVTNPPFSLFRDYIAQLMEYEKKFLIIGSQNAITYKEVFPLLQHNKMWVGYNSGDMAFKVPDYYEPRATRYWQDETGQKWRSMGNICWYTNLDIPKRHSPIDLRGNYYKGNEDQYPHYDNFDAIEVSKVADIPCDYDGIMGVPITFLDMFNPNQFEIVGYGKGELAKSIGVTKNHRGRCDLAVVKNGKRTCPYGRILIRLKEKLE